jgi:hypothetical protein
LDLQAQYVTLCISRALPLRLAPGAIATLSRHRVTNGSLGSLP